MFESPSLPSRRLLYRGTTYEFLDGGHPDDGVYHVADDLSEIVPLDDGDVETDTRRKLLRLDVDWGGTATHLELFRAADGVKVGRTHPGWSKAHQCIGLNSQAAFLYKYYPGPGGTTRGTMVLGFGATDLVDMWDWMDNLNVNVRTVRPGLTVHEGFFEYVVKVQECVTTYIDDLASIGIPISYNVGYSLGGAAATVFTNVHGNALNGLVTFGAPKTRGSGTSCTVTGVRYAHELDPVASNVMGLMSSFDHDVSDSYRHYIRRRRVVLHPLVLVGLLSLGPPLLVHP